MEKYFGGIKRMNKLPDIVILIGQINDITAVRECLKLQIPLISILDTNCDPTLSNFVVPANDDSISSVSIILNQMVKSINDQIY
jgi:small subunit ribosomal protein S2